MIYLLAIDGHPCPHIYIMYGRGMCPVSSLAPAAEIGLPQPDAKEIQRQHAQDNQRRPALAHPAVGQCKHQDDAHQRDNKGHPHGAQIGVARLECLLVLAAAKHGYLATATFYIGRFCHVDFTFSLQRYCFLGTIVIEASKC